MKTIPLLRALTLVLTVTSTALHAQVPQIINYQGRVAVGDPPVNFEGTGSFKFALVDAGLNLHQTATATPVITGGFGDGLGQRVTAINLIQGGSGYLVAPAVTISHHTGSGAAAIANIVGGVVTSFTITAMGQQYGGGTTVTIAPPPPNFVPSTSYWSNDGSSTAGSEPAAAISLPVTKGLYSVLLGANMTPVPASVFANPDVRLRVWFNDGTHGFQHLEPDQRIAAVGYAMMAGNVPDGAITGAKIAAGAVGSAQIAPTVGLWTRNGNDLSYQAGRVGIGTGTPATALEVAGTATATAFSGAFIGDGSGLTNIPASAVAGLVPETPPTGMALIPAGAVIMGNTTDANDPDAMPVNVTLSAFYMDVNEVTLELWQSVHTYASAHGYTFSNPGSGKGANHPVHTVNWYDVVKWCNARSEMEGLTPCYTLFGATYKTGEDPAVLCNWTANGYRLPTEAEWEKAARGGCIGHRFPWGSFIGGNLANYQGDTSPDSYDLGPIGFNAIGNDGTTPYTTPVGTFVANGFGLHDMAGNVWEWCWDWYGTPYAGGSDPHGPAPGSYRVVRGGSWFGYARYCRVADRIFFLPAYSSNNFGFRVARSLVP